MIKEVKSRLFGKTPKFWKKIQVIGLSIAGIGTALSTAPISVPIALGTWATYLITIGSTMVALSQLTIEGPKTEEKTNEATQ